MIHVFGKLTAAIFLMVFNLQLNGYMRKNLPS